VNIEHTQNIGPCGTAYIVGTEWQPNFKTYVDRAPVTDHHMFPNLPLNQDESIDKFTYLCYPQITDIISKNFEVHTQIVRVFFSTTSGHVWFSLIAQRMCYTY
jgi:hypothetical protein